MLPSHPKRRVLVVSATLDAGGAERFVSNLLGGVNRARFDMALCLFRDHVSYPVPDDVQCFILNHNRTLAAPRTVSRLRQVFDEYKPQVVLSNHDATGLYVGNALARYRSDRQLVWIARTSTNPTIERFRGFRGRFRKRCLRKVYAHADHVVANSIGLARRTVEAYSLPRERTRVIVNPVDVKQITALARQPLPHAADPKTPILVWVGRLHPQKRPDVLLDAFAQVTARQKAELWICGDGPLRDQVTRRINSSDLHKSVRMLGFCENPFALLANATLLVSTSDYEGLPNALIEAQALGVPVVSTDCPFGPAEIVEHEKTGLLTEVGNPAAIAAAVGQLLEQPAQRERMSSAAKASACAKFDLRTILSQWEQLFQEAATNAHWRAA